MPSAGCFACSSRGDEEPEGEAITNPSGTSPAYVRAELQAVAAATLELAASLGLAQGPRYRLSSASGSEETLGVRSQVV